MCCEGKRSKVVDHCLSKVTFIEFLQIKRIVSLFFTTLKDKYKKVTVTSSALSDDCVLFKEVIHLSQSTDL